MAVFWLRTLHSLKVRISNLMTRPRRDARARSSRCGKSTSTRSSTRVTAGARGCPGHVVRDRHVIHSLRTRPQGVANLTCRTAAINLRIMAGPLWRLMIRPAMPRHAHGLSGTFQLDRTGRPAFLAQVGFPPGNEKGICCGPCPRNGTAPATVGDEPRSEDATGHCPGRSGQGKDPPVRRPADSNEPDRAGLPGEGAICSFACPVRTWDLLRPVSRGSGPV